MSRLLDRYTPLFIIVGFILLVLTLYRDTGTAFYTLWNSDHNPTYSHGLLLLPVCITILIFAWYQHASKFRLCINGLTLLALLGVLAISILWLLASIATVLIVQMLALPLLLYLMLVAVLGFGQSRVFIFPLVLFLGAIPVWSILTPNLQWISAIASGWLTTITIHPSVREGMLIYIPAGTFEVEEGCSGLAYFIVAMIIALLFSYVHRHTMTRTVIQLVLAMAVAVVANIIRVYIIILSGELTDMQSYFITEEHVSLGWVIFFIGISLYLWQSQRVTAGIDKTNNELPEQSPAIVQKRGLSMPLGYLIVLLVFAASGPLLLATLQPGQRTNESPVIQLPDEIHGWQGIDEVYPYHPEFIRGDAEASRVYVDSYLEHTVYMYVNYFHHQRQGYEAISDLNQIADGQRWAVLSSVVIYPSLVDFRDVEESVIEARDGSTLLIWRWYDVNGYRSSIAWRAKVYNVLGVFAGKPGVRSWVVATELGDSAENARQRLRQFLVDTDHPSAKPLR